MSLGNMARVGTGATSGIALPPSSALHHLNLFVVAGCGVVFVLLVQGLNCLCIIWGRKGCIVRDTSTAGLQ